jgi:hypothetical protein
VRCGELCKGCTTKCNQNYSNGSYSEIECVNCGGDGKIGKDNCEQCKGKGHFVLDQCPNKFVGKLGDAINMAGWALKGAWPIDGGLLRQSHWFVELTTALNNDQNKIDQERWEAISKR